MSSSSQYSSNLGVFRAIIVGWLVVNVPAIVIIGSSLLIAAAIEPQAWWLFLSVGFILGWTWWSKSVPR